MVSNVIRYVHNNKIVKIDNIDPNETLLNYIRKNLKKTGTKEGCAEGGCGACTIVLGNLINNKINYQAINSCIMLLPTLHGKQLILVEDLLSKNGSLHPVQEAIVKYHGSQCGFCTPGFVMSLFSMYKNYYTFTEETIKNSIAGNLCRCTGYQPIINAAKNLNGKSKFDHFSNNKGVTIKLLKKINKIKENIFINNNINKYYAPKNINELKKLLNKIPNSKILSGGTDLSLEITKERKNLNSIIYLGSINELNYIKEYKNYLEIGATTPLIDFEKKIKKIYSDFYKILIRYGSNQIRNTATIAGNIATASPIGDTLPLLISLNSKLVIFDNKKYKTFKLDNFFINYRKTKLKKGQFIKCIQIPLYKKNIFKAYKISKRIDDDISSVCASFNIEIKNDMIKNIHIAYGGMSSIPKRAYNCEKKLINQILSQIDIKNAQKELEKDFTPITDMRASSEYRIEVAKNLLLKCFIEIKSKSLITIDA